MAFNAHAKVTKEVVAELLATKHREDRTLDYKQALPGANDEARNDFLADVTAMANTSGGVILFGIEEERDTGGKATGQPERVCGLPGVNVEQERQRLVNYLKNNVDPNIPGVDIYEVVGVADGPVIAVQTSRSWSAPHLIQMGKRVAFYRRNSVGNQPMDWHEIRSAFIAVAGERERIERFRNDRIGKIVSDAVGWPLKDTAKLILHVVPLGTVGGEAVIDMSSVSNRAIHLQPISSRGPVNYVLEGAVNNSVDPKTGASASYALLFREGIVEAVDADLVRPDEYGNRWIASVAFESEVRARIPGYLDMLRSYGLAPPIMLMLSATGVRGARMYVGSDPARNRRQIIGHDTIVLAPVVLNDYGGQKDVDRIFKPMFDAFWNAAGWAKSLNWDDDGNWIGDRRG